MSDKIDRYDIERLRSIADWLASFPNDDYKSDALFIEDVVSKIVAGTGDPEFAAQLEAAAESLGEPAAWLVQHPKYMPEPCVEIASSDYHDHGVMETEKAQGWVFTALYAPAGDSHHE